MAPWPKERAGVVLENGVLGAILTEQTDTYFGWTYGLERMPDFQRGHGPLLPRVVHYNRPAFKQNNLILPLWLLAFVCLAWPVTSFVIARRRRRGRGFEVEVADS